MANIYFFKISVFFLVTITISKHEEQTCELESCEPSSTSHWKRKSNDIQSKISKALEEYNKQNKSRESIYSVIKQDLKPFYNSHITKKMISSSSQMGTKYQLIDHKLYRDKGCMFPTRCKGIEHFLLEYKNLSDYELIINTRDFPQVHKALGDPLPVFSFSKTDDYFDIMYPAWSFWCGGPAISLYPTGIGRWDKVRKSLIKTSQKWSWKKKKNLGFFRGSRTSNERDELIYLSRSSPDLVDAAYTKNQAWKSDQDTLHYPPAQEVSFEEHCVYKYLFNFRGVAASFRLKHLFLCRSLVFHVGSEWNEYFYPNLIPWVHYIPVESDYTRDTLKELIHFFNENDELAEEIANRGYEFIKSNLRLKDVSLYWKKLLTSYGRLLDYKPSLDKSLIEITE